jgi:hypothetical protein
VEKIKEIAVLNLGERVNLAVRPHKDGCEIVAKQEAHDEYFRLCILDFTDAMLFSEGLRSIAITMEVNRRNEAAGVKAK